METGLPVVGCPGSRMRMLLCLWYGSVHAKEAQHYFPLASSHFFSDSHYLASMTPVYPPDFPPTSLSIPSQAPFPICNPE